MDTPRTRPVSFARFAEYLTTAGPDRVGVARSIVAQLGSAYSPATDHYAAIRRALIEGTCKGDLGQRLRQAVVNASPTRKPAYRRLARRYRRWYLESGVADALVHKIEPRACPDLPLPVRVSPAFVADLPDGRRVAVALYLKNDPLDPAAAAVMSRLLARAYPDRQPVVLDVQHSRTHAAAPAVPDYDEWLATEATAFAGLASRLRQATSAA
jgi:hypothetical protein